MTALTDQQVATMEALGANVQAYVDHAISQQPGVSAHLQNLMAQVQALSIAQSPVAIVTRLQTAPNRKFLTGQRPVYGMDQSTGQLITGVAHIHQSITNLLQARVGSRVMRRSYGSSWLHYLDQPLNERNLLAIYAAVSQDLALHEPRINVQSLQYEKADLTQGKGWLRIQWVLNDAYRWMSNQVSYSTRAVL